MNRWLHTIRMGALAFSLAGLLANCGGGGGGGDDGGSSLRLFFGINGEGSCSSVVVNVDLADAEAVLARKNDDNPDCTIDLGLANRGCVATYAELNDGEDLRVTIAGCTIPGVTNLFSCLFEDVDLSDLVTESSAQCACAVPGCDGTPPLCIDEDLDPRSCEDCDNGIDDDGNGTADCDDPNCEHAPECNTSTTIPPTSTTEVVVTTTIDATTTTTLAPEPISINFALSAPSTPLATLQFTVNYTSAPGDFEGGGTSVLCENAVDDSLFAANNNEQLQKLTLGWGSVAGFGAPTALVSCDFLPDTPVPVPANFTVVIDEATDLAGERVRGVNITVTVTGVP